MQCEVLHSFPTWLLYNCSKSMELLCNCSQLFFCPLCFPSPPLSLNVPRAMIGCDWLCLSNHQSIKGLIDMKKDRFGSLHHKILMTFKFNFLKKSHKAEPSTVFSFTDSNNYFFLQFTMWSFSIPEWLNVEAVVLMLGAMTRFNELYLSRSRQKIQSEDCIWMGFANENCWKIH